MKGNTLLAQDFVRSDEEKGVREDGTYADDAPPECSLQFCWAEFK